MAVSEQPTKGTRPLFHSLECEWAVVPATAASAAGIPAWPTPLRLVPHLTTFCWQIFRSLTTLSAFCGQTWLSFARVNFFILLVNTDKSAMDTVKHLVNTMQYLQKPGLAISQNSEQPSTKFLQINLNCNIHEKARWFFCRSVCDWRQSSVFHCIAGRCACTLTLLWWDPC